MHRDLKGANVLVTRNGIIKLADFGASKVYCDARTDAMKSMRGSVYWMAPEVIKGSYGGCSCAGLSLLRLLLSWPACWMAWRAMASIRALRTARPLFAAPPLCQL